ncbi:hypothetical protein M406DRAFT_67753 [Cryphonectria parasitica EP155]|uniref:Uncharacterized protein n=1 Tax=Cryphonectria parasitica (strain ATCC 38755 / EP155) TaxID=660469 RepID=A0A9P4Y2R4_CRYP1|nr:uncharacterized protein M406DRAFT_67753 [Cryphonectria parasitica EP155]KAF3765297.1 hypothetical protein M406DRAFT_67753 [Cryphonectria parasitica EP155]
MHSNLNLSILALLASAATAKPLVDKRQEDLAWGPICGFYQTTSEITGTTSTIFPGKMPSGQKGYMFNWIGITNTTGDLVQSVVGSYPSGLSECEGQAAADTAWCVSSEVYGLNAQDQTTQFVGTKTTADANYENGIIIKYTLVDKETYLWNQTMHDAVTGTLLSTYQKTSGAFSLWNTAVELQDQDGNSPTGLTEDQYYLNTTITLDPADAGYGDMMYTQNGCTHTTPTTSDGGKTLNT